MERKLYAALRSGREFKGDLAVSFYQQFGISAKTLDGIDRQLQAKLKSVSELAKTRAADLETRVSAKRKRIADIDKKLGVLLRKGDVRPHGLRHSLHQHKRRLAILENRRIAAKERIGDPRICFGSRRLFGAQHHLEEHRFDNHADWVLAWQAARSAQFFVEGAARSQAGNPFVRLTAREDGAFYLELRLPETLGYLAEHETVPSGHVVRSIYFGGLRFAHGDAEIREALATSKPLSYRFLRDQDGSWFVSVMLRQEFAEPSVMDFSNGCLGVDLNSDHVALTLVDPTGNPLTTLRDALGNPVMTRRIDLVTYGKTKAQRLDMIRKAAAEVAMLADQLGVPVATEKLDFSRKRAELETSVGTKRARMLSSFAYSTFAEALARVCVRRSVRLVLVNPAYTSIIGLVKFAPRYGSSVHAAAALAIARRAMALSERLPTSGESIPAASRLRRPRHPPATCKDRAEACVVVVEQVVASDCQRSMQDTGGRAAGRDRTERGREIRPAATGTGSRPPSPDGGEIPRGRGRTTLASRLRDDLRPARRCEFLRKSD